MDDKPGQLNEIATLCSQEKINILEVEHSRFTLDLSVRAARLNITLETRNEKHAKTIISKIKNLGFKVEEKKKINTVIFFYKTFLNFNQIFVIFDII